MHRLAQFPRNDRLITRPELAAMNRCDRFRRFVSACSAGRPPADMPAPLDGATASRDVRR
jgi:hypothetical protein